jgi:predicted nucleic acid-binding protein
MTAREAWGYIEDWLEQDMAWIPLPTSRHRQTLGRLVAEQHVTGNLVPDAHLVSLAIEHGVAVCSFDTDIARFPDVTWINPAAR